MKNFILIAIAALNIGFMTNANAAGTAFTDSTTVTEADCSLLSQDVKLNASANVNAAWGCTVADNLAYGAACHEGGSSKERTVDCSCATADKANNNQCPGSCVASVYTPSDDGGDSVTTIGRQAFGGSTNGGSIASFAFSTSGAGDPCDATTIAGISLFENDD